MGLGTLWVDLIATARQLAKGRSVVDVELGSARYAYEDLVSTVNIDPNGTASP
jgi:hypothetical protein